MFLWSERQPYTPPYHRNGVICIGWDRCSALAYTHCYRAGSLEVDDLEPVDATFVDRKDGWDPRWCAGTGEYFTREDWFRLPLRFRQRWWRETNFNRSKPNRALVQSLMDELDFLLDIEREWKAKGKADV